MATTGRSGPTDPDVDPAQALRYGLRPSAATDMVVGVPDGARDPAVTSGRTAILS